MDIEKAVEHLLDLHFQAERRMDRFEKQLRSTQALVKAGVKIVIAIGRAQKQTEAQLKELAATQQELAEGQRKTQSDLDRLVKALLRRGGNGRAPAERP